MQNVETAIGEPDREASVAPDGDLSDGGFQRDMADAAMVEPHFEGAAQLCRRDGCRSGLADSDTRGGDGEICGLAEGAAACKTERQRGDARIPCPGDVIHLPRLAGAVCHFTILGGERHALGGAGHNDRAGGQRLHGGCEGGSNVLIGVDRHAEGMRQFVPVRLDQVDRTIALEVAAFGVCDDRNAKGFARIQRRLNDGVGDRAFGVV